MDLTSILDLPPLEEGGRNARRGFAFQDHAAARLCLRAIVDGAPSEIRVEQHDDITLVWRNGADIVAEFVQVKAHARSARWSPASLTAHDSDGGMSLLEKSLRQARGREPSRFRIITTTDTDDRLSLLKVPFDDPERSSDIFEQLVEDLDHRLPGIVSDNGTNVRDWARWCLWEKPADSVEGLNALNIRLLEEVLTSRGVNVPYVKRDDIYESLLRMIAVASSADEAAAAMFTVTSLEEWLVNAIAETTTILWTKTDIRAVIDRCRAATEVEINTRVGRKYIPELYVEREIDRTCSAFVAGEDRSFILVERAGSGKTNLLCNLSLRHASDHPVLFFSGRLALSNGGLVAEVLDRIGPHAEGVFRDLRAASCQLLVVIDGINENNEPHAMRDALIRLIQFAADKPIKLVVSCRDLFWPLFDGEHWGSGTIRAGARAKARSHTLHDFTAEEFETARGRYFEYFGVKAHLRGEARLKCRHPLLLRFFCEAYGDTDGIAAGSAFEDIRLKTLFDVYWSRKLERIREFSDEPMVKGAITDVLFAIGEFLLSNHRKDISRYELHTIGAALGSALLGVLSRICDEDIIVAQDGDLGVTSFVYDEFMEYTMSRMLFERHRWKQATAAELTLGIVDLLDARREYSHVQNVAQYLLLWIEDEHPDIHDEVVLALVRSGRPVCRRVVASAAPKFRRVSPQNLRALEMAASDSDDVERGEVAFAVARLYRQGEHNDAVSKIFRSLAKRASPFVAASLLSGLETATVLSRHSISFVIRWSDHRDVRVRLAVADFLASDAARAEPELRPVLLTLATDVETTVQDAALLSGRVVLASEPSEYVATLLAATSPGGVAAGVAWLVEGSGFADRVNLDELATTLAARGDSTLDKTALQLARTLEDPRRRVAIAEEVCRHMDYRSYHEAAKLVFASGDPATSMRRYKALAYELGSAAVITKGVLRKSQGSLRRRRALIERIFETADWEFLAGIDAELTFEICSDLFGPRGISEQRLTAFLNNLQPLVEMAFATDPRAASLIVESVRQGSARNAEALIAWAETHVHVTAAWSDEQLTQLLEALSVVPHRMVGYVGFLRFLATTRSEEVLVGMSKHLARTGLAGVCAAVMRLLTSEARSHSASQPILTEASLWSMSTCTEVASAMHVTNDSKHVLVSLGRQWVKAGLFEPLLRLTGRIQEELPGWAPDWFRNLREAGLYELALVPDLCIRAFGRYFSSDDVRSSALQLLHAQWVTLCEAAATSLREPGFGYLSELARRETEVIRWQ